MKIVGVRDGFLKIETEKAIELSSFLQISGNEKCYVAQILQLKNNGTGYFIYAKILFLLIEGILCDYDKTVPGMDSEIQSFPFENIAKLFYSKTPVFVGQSVDKSSDVMIDKSYFNNKMLVVIDSKESNTVLTTNLMKQFIAQNEQVIVIDTLGITDGEKYIAGKDFRLPLNESSLEFIYSDCLNDATSDSKLLIKEIFKDLIDYAKTVDFLPFNTLKTIIDDMVNNSHIFKLMVLKNKLAKFENLGYFATNLSESTNLKNILLSGNAVIDLSKLDSVFQNRYLSMIYSEIEKLSPNIHVIVQVSNLVNKQNLKTIMMNEVVKSTFITHSKFKYINEIKKYFSRFIIEPTFTNKELFKEHALFLNSIKKDNILIAGDCTNNIPIAINLVEYIPKENIIKNIQNNIDDSFFENVNSDEKCTINNEQKDVVNPEIQNVAELVAQKSDDIINKFQVEIDEENVLLSKSDIFENENDADSEISFSTQVHSNKPDEQENIIDNENIEVSTEFAEIETEQVEENNSNIIDTSFKNVTADIIKNEELPNEEQIGSNSITETEIVDLPNVTEDSAILQKNTEIITENPETLDIEPSEILLQNFEEINDAEAIIDENLDTESINDKTNEEFNADEIIELDASEFQDGDIVIEMDDTESLSETERIEQEIIEDVDSLYTTVKDESISDSDLDFIDQLNEVESDNLLVNNNDNEVLEQLMEQQSDSETEILEPDDNNDENDSFIAPLEEISDFASQSPEKDILETKPAQTTTVPMYEAEIPEEDKVVSDFIEQGDTVIHAKYGTGIVEKMIKYGNKDLYSINFDKVGRRLLDPTLTEIKKA